jgi:isoquinoline 1-oxidoreductase alpha subunit
MLWQGLSNGDLCRMLKDPARNGKRTGKNLLEHMETEPLVLWGWNPGPGREPVPIPHAQFVELVKTWVAGGMACPNRASQPGDSSQENAMIKLDVNGQTHELDLNPKMPLLWAIRDKLNLTGTKFGCGHAMCGACTVHINGQAARSCSIMVGEAAGKKIVTIEGLSGPVAEAVTKSWQELNVVQCGYCQSGQIMSAITLLSENRKPTDHDINLSMDGNICRCGTYARIRQAIHEAAKKLA